MDIKSNLALEMLEGWVVWSRQDIGTIHFPSRSVLSVSPAYRSCGITEDEALRVDHIVSVLKCRDHEQHQALVEYLYFGCNLSHVGRALKCHHTRASLLVSSAFNWVDGVLYAMDEKDFDGATIPEHLMVN